MISYDNLILCILEILNDEHKHFFLMWYNASV